MPKLSAPKVSDRRRHDWTPPVTLPKVVALERTPKFMEYGPHPDSDPMPAHVLANPPAKANGHTPAHVHCFVVEKPIRLVLPAANAHGVHLLQPYEAGPGEDADLIKEPGDWLEITEANPMLLQWASANVPRKLRRATLWETFERQHRS